MEKKKKKKKRGGEKMHLEKPSEISLFTCARPHRGFCVFTGARGALLNIKPQTIKTTTELS